MTSTEAVISATGTPLAVWVPSAELVIAAGTVLGVFFSIWFSIKSLRRSDWNSSMSTAPSITMNCTWTGFWMSKFPSGGGSWGEPTHFLDASENYITMSLGLLVLNQGRGVALSIKKPEISCEGTSRIERIDIPVSMGIRTSEPAELQIFVTEQHSRWVTLMANPIDIEIKLSYKNDQGNILCISKWTAKLKPFDLEGTRLVIRDYNERILSADMRVEYKTEPT